MQLPAPVISTDWLNEHLGEPGLRIFDVSLNVEYKGDSGSFGGYRLDAETPRKEWEASHIPGSAFIDINRDLFDKENPIPFMMPEPGDFATAIAEHGVADGTGVILFSKGSMMWATRIWYMLRSIGFENAGILDGGWEKWEREGKPTTTEVTIHPKGQVTVNWRPDMWVNKDKMLDVIANGGPTMVNALPPEVYNGKLNRYGRSGHIPGSYSVPCERLLDSETGEFLKADQLRPLFTESGALEADQVIAYCGGGISATMDCFAMSICGQNNLAVYDGSMNEWVLDDELPLKLGNQP